MSGIAVLLGACMLLHYAAALLLFGTALARVMLAKAGGTAIAAIERPLHRSVAGAALVALATAAVLVPLQARSMAGDWAAAIDPAAIAAVFYTAFGRVWTVHLVIAAALLLFAFTTLGAGRWLLAVSALLVASLGFIGHAAMEEGGLGIAHRLNHAVHLLAAGAWLGGLVPLALMLTRTPATIPPRASASVLGRFSGYGTIAVIVVLASGAINTLIIAGGVGKLVASFYGGVLLAKLVLVALMVCLALVNRFWFLPSLERESEIAVSRLRRSVTAELLIGVAVLLAAVVLGSSEPP